MPTRNVNLTEHFDKFIEAAVVSGRFSNASEVVREALRLMDDRDQLFALQKDEIRRKITAGMNSLRAGKSSDSEAYFDRIDTELDEIDSCASK